MKKSIFTLATLALLSVVPAQAQTAQIALQHANSITMYNASKMDEAMTAAVDGDTLFLNEGVFAPFEITKKVTIIGSGTNTIVTGTITIAIPDSVTLTSYLLDAMNIKGDVTVKADCPVNGVKMRKVQFYSMNFNAVTGDSFLERCYLTGAFNTNGNCKGIAVYNSKVWQSTGNPDNEGDVCYTNCNLRSVNYTYNSMYGYHQASSCTYVNCIIRDGNSDIPWGTTKAIFSNCLIQGNWYTRHVNDNCWEAALEEDTNLLNDSIECTLDEAMLAGYVGSDGTQVGIYGGAIPFTLAPSMPRVTEHTITVDAENRKLNVTLKVTAN